MYSEDAIDAHKHYCSQQPLTTSADITQSESILFTMQFVDFYATAFRENILYCTKHDKSKIQRYNMPSKCCDRMHAQQCMSSVWDKALFGSPIRVHCDAQY